MTTARILLVEDEDRVRTVLRSALAQYDLIDVPDAEGALDLLTVGQVDLIITDIALRRMDGCALAARVRDRWPNVPMIAISGYVGDRDVEEFAFDGFLSKPVELAALRTMVADLLARVTG